MSIAIKAHDISKAYQIGEFSTGTISRDIERWWKLIRGREDPYLKIGETNDRSVKGESDVVWSLKDINFDIEQGDTVGIIGRNGAGKSTLLKVLSRVTTPTTGSIKVKGRIASLLEVGTGFHPELTGRENIYLNGAILGMRKHEIKRHFDAIVDFSGVERYIDTPVKRFSSGMYVRLAFAVAAHLESEILIVDEVLAVGDADFQKKCLGKMGDVSKSEGRTVLFVSHNMMAIKNLCEKSIHLQNGKVHYIADTNDVISNYLANVNSNLKLNLAERKDRIGNGKILIQSVELRNNGGNLEGALQCGSAAIFRINFLRKNNESLSKFHLAMGINDEHGNRITHFSNEVTNQVFSNLTSDFVEIIIECLPLKKGNYSYTIYSTVDNEVADYIQDAGNFEVEAGDFYKTGILPPEGQGNFFINHKFRI